MDNDINNNMGNGVEKKKSNSIIMVIIVIIILVIIAIVAFRKNNSENQQPLSQSDIELNQAVTSDTTKSITDNLNSIDLSDTSDADLISVDEELGKL